MHMEGSSLACNSRFDVLHEPDPAKGPYARIPRMSAPMDIGRYVNERIGAFIHEEGN
jgi:hypothetical protein